ncbi:GntR family transcriptional regulator [Paraburkholderia sediminicola]|uniref:GntR family transcriptional regulator n=1 Tax=Paraburkholderia sediminicola TaxID=458836 RepID=UPI0038B7C4AF
MLAQEYGTCRDPIREAIRWLQGTQLITREPYAKARVIVLSADAALELFPMRAALEGMACSLATQRMSDSDLEKLLEELEQDRATYREKGKTSERIFDFHERIVYGCKNQRIINALCGGLYHLLRFYRRHSGTVLERKEHAYSEHW